MAFLYNNKLRRVLLTVILVWSTTSFCLTNRGNYFLLIPVLAVSVLALIFIISEISAIFLLLFMSFLSSYALYIFLFQYNLPSWLIMLAILVIFGYLFTYTEQKIGILGNKRLIYLFLFSLISLEIFLILTYFLIDPISLSLIIASISYLFIGFCYTVLAKHTDNNFKTYLVVTGVVISLIFLGSRWEGI